MEDMTCSTLDSDCLMDILEAFLFKSSLPSNENPAEEGFDQIFGLDPLQPPTEGDMPHGAAPFGLQELVLPAPGFNVAPIDFPPLPPYYAAAEEGSDPQQPPTGGDMPHGAAPFGLQQPVLHAPGFPAGPMDFPPLPPYYAAAEEGFHPQQPHTYGAIRYGAAPFGLQQPVLPAPGPGPSPPGYQPLTALEPSYMQPAAPCRRGQVENEPWTLPWIREMNLTPLGFINGQIVYGLPTDSAPPVASDVPVLKAHTPRKSKSCRVDERKPYIKKPPNAFMIFRTEQRVTFVADLQKQDCAAINKVIGQRWKSLPKEEQAKYYGYADKERQLHSQLFPEWSASDNYGLKRKRIRRKGPMMENPAI